MTLTVKASTPGGGGGTEAALVLSRYDGYSGGGAYTAGWILSPPVALGTGPPGPAGVCDWLA